MVGPLKLPHSLNRNEVNGLLYYTQQRGVARGVFTDTAMLILAEKETTLAQTNLLR
jgi:hypothetical protein